MVEAGCDVIEVGLPYTDPLMDGPIIQDAVHQALNGGTKSPTSSTGRGDRRAGAPTLVMTYWNPVDRYGVDAFARDLASAGGAGLITPDLTPGGGAALARRRPTRTTWTGSSSSRSAPPTSASPRSPGCAAGSSTPPQPDGRHRRESDAVDTGAAGLVERTREATGACRLAVGLGVSHRRSGQPRSPRSPTA